MTRPAPPVPVPDPLPDPATIPVTDPLTGPVTDPVLDAAILDEQQHAAALLHAARRCLDPAPGDPRQSVPPSVRPSVRPGRRPLTLESAATVVLRDHLDGAGSLLRLAEALPGWDRRLAPGRVARLEARRAGRTLAASYVEDERVLVLSVVSAPLPVTRAQSRRLRAAREGAA